MYQTLLVGTDGSPTAAEAVEVALLVAAPLGAHVHVLSVSDADEDAARSALAAPAARAAELGVACTTHVGVGTNAGRVIVETAARVGADLVVVGDRGMHGVNRLLSGSVPNHVAHNAPCSVLLVDSTRRAEPAG
jgi:nucleotide-binding universal stress UspA family protein